MGLRARLLLLVLLPTIPALILGVFTSLKQRQAGRYKAEAEALRLAEVVAGKQLSIVEASRQHLSALARFPAARENNIRVFTNFFTQMRSVYLEYTDLGLVEINGDLVACSYGQIHTNVADRAFLKRVLATQALSVGVYESGIATSTPSIVFGYPVMDEKGRVVRVIYAAVDLAVFNRALARETLPESGAISVIDSQGTIVAHAPAAQADARTGEPFAKPWVLAGMRSRRAGVTEIREAAGVRLCAFAPVGPEAEPTLQVAASFPLSAAYAESNRILALNVLVLGAVAVLALAGAWFYGERHILRPVRKLAQTTSRVASGDLSARTGIAPGSGELNQLARAFDQMADSLEQQRLQNYRLHAELEDRVKERTAQLELSNKELEAFSYSVSHDLRAPLRHIHGHVQRFQDELGPQLDDHGRGFLKLISDAAKRMGALIDSLLAFSRMGRVDITASSVNTAELVDEVLQELKRDTEGRHIDWEIAPLPVVKGDRALLKQVMANLLSNAVKYTRQRDKARVAVTVVRHAAEIEFRVEDNGAGFDMRYAHKLFRVFERLHRPEEFEGTGIGLANVRRIILRHGGRTWAEGKPGVGATFFFTLPQTPAPETKTLHPS